MIVSRFTSFTKNFVISCNQVTKIFGTRWSFASASSAMRPCNFGSQADFAISVCAKWVWLLWFLNFESRIWVLKNVCAGAGTSVSWRFSVNSSNDWGRSRKRSSESRLSSLFLFLFWVLGESRLFPDAGSSLRSVAGLEDGLDDSCGNDVATNWHQNLTTLQGQQEVRSFLFCTSVSFQPILCRPHTQIRKVLSHDVRRDIPNLEFSSSHASIGSSQIVFPIIVLPEGDHINLSFKKNDWLFHAGPWFRPFASW